MVTLTLLLVVVGLVLNFWAGLRLFDKGLSPFDPIEFVLASALVSALLALGLMLDLGVTREVQPGAIFFGLWLVGIGGLLLFVMELREGPRSDPYPSFALITSLLSLLASILGIISFYLQHGEHGS